MRTVNIIQKEAFSLRSSLGIPEVANAHARRSSHTFMGIYVNMRNTENSEIRILVEIRLQAYKHTTHELNSHGNYRVCFTVDTKRKQI